MKKVIKITERDLEQIVKKVLSEQIPDSRFSNFEKKGTNYGLSNPFGKASQKPNINPENLKKGDGGKYNPKKIEAVKKLQARLIELGLLSTSTGKPTGYFGDLTQKALDRYNDPKYTVGQSSKPTKEPTKKSSETGKGVTKTAAVKQAAKCETGTEAVLSPDASLIFDGDNLIWLVGGKQLKSWSAVSGLTWKNTPPKDWGSLLKKYTQNRQEWSKEKNAGPLPEGQYLVGPLETRNGQPEEIGAIEAFWYKLTGQVEDKESDRAFCKNTLLSRISWGNYRLSVTPTGGQKMYGRGDFYVHGGSLRGSHGCIDLTDDMDDFAKFFTVWSTTNGKKKIPMTVKYKNPMLNQIISKLVDLM